MEAYKGSASADTWTTPEEREAFRHALIPTWIKLFSWLFILISSAASIIFLLAVATDSVTDHYEGPLIALLLLICAAYIVAPGVCGYGLLYAKNWGLNACLIWGYITLVIFLFDIFSGPNIALRLDIIVLLFFLRRLHKIRPLW